MDIANLGVDQMPEEWYLCSLDNPNMEGHNHWNMDKVLLILESPKNNYLGVPKNKTIVSHSKKIKLICL